MRLLNTKKGTNTIAIGMFQNKRVVGHVPKSLNTKKGTNTINMPLAYSRIKRLWVMFQKTSINSFKYTEQWNDFKH